MSEDKNWGDASREDLRKTIQQMVLGEIRLANSTNEDIAQNIREVFVEDECPEEEWAVFSEFTDNELKKALTLYSLEQEKWPVETDCDRLNRAEDELRDSGILLWQVSPCCDTCSNSELPDRIDAVNQEYPGFREKVRGYAFFIDQNMADMLSESTEISIYLAYGWFPADGESVSQNDYENNAIKIGNEVCKILIKQGLKPNWDGDLKKKIGLSLSWQRRAI